MSYVEAQKVPAKTLRHIIDATFPSYRKRSVYIKPTDSVTFNGLNWSGGSRAEYRACSIDGKPAERKIDMSLPAPWENPYEGATINLPQGMVIVEGGYFCGKPSVLRISYNPGDTQLLIEGSTD